MVVQEEMLHTLTNVKFDPLGQVLVFVAEDGTNCENKSLISVVPPWGGLPLSK